MQQLNNFLMSKKGDEKVFSIWWFLVIAVVGLGIVMGVWIFYGADTDVRQIEAEMLYNRIADCLVDNGFINEKVMQENFDVFEECGLHKESFNETSAFYLRINISDAGNPKKTLGNKISVGQNFETECNSVIGFPGEEERPEAENFPRCVKRQERALYYDTWDNEVRRAVIEILIASNNQGEQISL